MKFQQWIRVVLFTSITIAFAFAQNSSLKSQNLDPLYPWFVNLGYDEQNYDIQLSLSQDFQFARGQTTMSAVATDDLESFSLDFGNMRVLSVTVNGLASNFSRSAALPTKLLIRPVQSIAKQHKFAVTINYEGQPGMPWAWLLGGFAFSPGAFTITQAGGLTFVGQPSRMMTWTPINEYAGDKATFRLALTTVQPRAAISNNG